eukprot:3531071-Amphidinium_carterae.1
MVFANFCRPVGVGASSLCRHRFCDCRSHAGLHIIAAALLVLSLMVSLHYAMIVSVNRAF